MYIFHDPDCVLQIDLLTSIDVMYRVVDKGHLPVELGGHLSPYHQRWVRFRQVILPISAFAATLPNYCGLVIMA